MKILSQSFCAVTKTIVIVLLLGNANFELPTLVYAETGSQANPLVKSSKQNDELAAFLSVPIDLIAFKNKKGPSNSGSFKASPWMYRPEERGFFYQYMLFNTPTRYSEGYRFYGFSIVVYKFGNVVGDYYDKNETLVAIWCGLEDPDLGQANLVGKLVSEIKARFGEPFAVDGDVLIYHYNGRVLSVHTKDGAVDWFKYVRLNRDLDAHGTVPNLLRQPVRRPGPEW